MSKRQRKARYERRRGAVAARSAGAAGGLAVVATLLSGAVAEADTFTVNTLSGGTGSGTLYSAITQSNADTSPTTPGRTIVFSSGLTGEIGLTASLPGISEPVTITGPGANVLTVSGQGNQGIFFVENGLSATTEISGLTLTGSDNKYGAVEAESPLTLTGDVIEGNEGEGPYYGTGGVVAGDGLTLVGSTVSGNRGTGVGGVGAYGGAVTIQNSTIANNTGYYGNGGILSHGGTLSVLDSTISGNQALGTGTNEGLGGGIYIGDTDTSVDLQNTIVSGNTASQGGSDIDTSTGAGAPTPTAEFSLIGSLTGSGITAASSDLVGMNPLLGSLQNNGGSTSTMAPAINSPVIDKGNSEGLTTDERGLARPVDLPGYPNAAGGDGADIGAVELQASEVAPTVVGLSSTSGAAGTPVTILGLQLSTATQVLFGSTAAKFTVNGSGQPVAIAPAGVAGTVDVRVVTPGGESAAVAADKFTFPAQLTPTPTPTPNLTTATFGNQQIALATPSLAACTASTSPLSATLASSALSHGTKLKFSSAGFFLDRGIKHVKKKTEHLKHGKTKHVTVTTYTANVTVHHVPVTVSLSLTGLKAGSHTLKVVISYTEKVTKHHKTKTETVTKTISSKFNVC